MVSHSADRSFSSPLPSGMAVLRRSLCAVDPLQRGEAATGGLSQLLQSLSSKWSTVNGVQEKCLVRFEFTSFGRPRFALLESVRGPTERGESVGVGSLNTLATCGREDVTEARIVSLSPSLWRPETLLPMPKAPLMGSSPTATCRRSSTKVHSPVLKSSAICFMPMFGGDADEERGVHVARFDMPLAARGCRVRF